MELTTLFTVMRELRSVFPILSTWLLVKAARGARADFSLLALRINKVPYYQGCQTELDSSLSPACAYTKGAMQPKGM